MCVRLLLLGTTALCTLVIAAGSSPVLGDCSYSSGTATCTGDLFGGKGVEFENQTVDGVAIDTVIVENLTGDIDVPQNENAAYVLRTAPTGGSGSGSGAGGTGGSSASTSVTLDGAPYGVAAAGQFGGGILSFSFAGSGGQGGSERDFSSATAGSGGQGGVGGGAGAAMLSGFVTITKADAGGLSSFSQGGAGGSAGIAASDDGTSRAGNGGAGGKAGAADTTLLSGTITMNGAGSRGVEAISLGGSGGAGGVTEKRGAAGFLGAQSGAGGAGGAGNSATISVSSGAISVTGANSRGLFSSSRGGAGGSGGSAAGTTGEIRGGTGGTGGAGNTAKTLIEALTVGAGDGAVGMLVESAGGSGGFGGAASGETATSPGIVAGNGGAGGNAGLASAAIGAASIRTGSADALFVYSVAGNGGGGGAANATTGDAYGGTGGRGGSGGPATATLTSGAITTIGTNAAGIFTQSRAGDGGSGGAASVTIGNAFGGAGGAGGTGGSVMLTADGHAVNIATNGAFSDAVRLQSLGGSGGDGGFGRAFNSDFFDNGNGGDGGAGGAGGSVTAVITDGTLSTAGAAAQGLFARSYGGAGGNGGGATGGQGKGGAGSGSGPAGALSVSFGGTIRTTGAASNAILAHTVGGFSGNAGDSSGFVAYGAGTESAGAGGMVTVNVVSGSTITTTGDEAVAVTAQSVGGGGGKGSSGTGLVGLGGSGSAGGAGGKVSLSSGAAITTMGETSRGLWAQSLGGGGGDGGSARGLVAVGGSGGSGGFGSTVTLANSGTITTSGRYAEAIQATSVGGGGGSARSTSGIVSLGGNGGGGGAGGNVGVTNTASLATFGTGAEGVFSQSVGGGGGDGSNALGVGVGFSLAIGGKGGVGGAGGNVSYTDVRNNVTVPAGAYTIATGGDLSDGVFAQSVGGGGGHGGSEISASASIGIDVSLGHSGSGGAAAAGGAVNVGIAGNVTTRGDHSKGIYASSVGGGGGSAGSAINAAASEGLTVTYTHGGSGGGGGNGGAATVNAAGNVTTAGHIAHGIHVSSVGGGGGHSGKTVSGGVGALAVNVTLGGSGGGGGNASTVTVRSGGKIATSGHQALGVVAASIGGGGGSAYLTADGAAGGLTVSPTIGGSGGGGGAGGNVTSVIGGSIATTGHGAAALVAKSVGGGGGDGGSVIAGSAISAGNVGVTVGGKGGGGNNAGTVKMTAGAAITTAGDNAEGILAHSIAGGGGSSGLVVGASGVSLANIDVTVGGSGGSGGSAGAVTLNATGGVATTGAFSSAVDAKSIGGGGGNAKGSVSASALSMGDVAVTLGSAGGAGGSGGTVTVATGGAISTEGIHAHGIIAQSHGGGGGEGGFAAEGSITGGEFSGEVGVTLGGGGGSGGKAGKVSVTSTGSIATADLRSHAIVAQSIGGNGGQGGNVYTGNFSFSSDASVNVNVDIGGSGGSGATGNDVSVSNTASLMTAGAFARGILAQSIGGGGGEGGNAYTVSGGLSAGSSGSASVSLGGSGGTGAAAGAVSVTNKGAIATRKGEATAIHAASVGGSGGVGGNAGNLFIALPGGQSEGSSYNFKASFAMGGSGGKGGTGNSVTVNNTADITTAGIRARGIVAHSVGGGGGDGGTASSYTLNLGGVCKLPKTGGSFVCKQQASDPDSEATNVSASLDIVVGGKGGSGNDAGNVSVKNSATVETIGKLSHAIQANSHGGGGGNGGEGDLGVAAFTSNKTAETIAKFTNFAKLPSFTSASVGVGGSAGAAGDGGSVTVMNTEALTTKGDQAFGVHAQSVGGGGGNGGMGSTGVWSTITVGGAGGAAGDGGAVSVSSSGTIVTEGQEGIAIFAQSVGGGGGTAGDVAKGFAASWENLNIGVGVGAQLDGGSAGDGGQVDVTADAIITTGKRGHGVVAQSVGGGGGIAAVSGVLAPANFDNFVGSAGASGNGGDVNVTVNGAIDVSGAGAHGVFAQSASGASSGDTSGDVTLKVNADIAASGSRGRAVLVQSASAVESVAPGRAAAAIGAAPVNAGNGIITIDVASGATMSTGTSGYETIGLRGGRANIINNAGTIEQGNAAAFAIRSDGTAGLTVNNTGTIVGGINAPFTTFNNEVGGTYRLVGTANDLGTSGGSFVNAGTLLVGTDDAPRASLTTGSFVQTATGTYALDLDFPRNSSLLILDTVTTATFAGSVTPTPVSGTPRDGETGSFRIIEANLGVDASALTVADTATVDYSILSPFSQSVALGYKVDYTPWDGPWRSGIPRSVLGRIDANHTAFGEHVDRLIGARRSFQNADFLQDLVLYLLQVETVGELVSIYDTYAPGELFAADDAALNASRRFSSELGLCPDVAAGKTAVITNGESCAMAKLYGVAADRDEGGLVSPYDERAFGIFAGAERGFGNGWSAGGAVSYERSGIEASRYDGDANRFHVGATVARAFGATELRAKVSGGLGNIDFERTVLTPSGPRTVGADPMNGWLATHARLAHTFGAAGVFSVTPSVTVGAEYQHQAAFSERGAGAWGLDVDPFNATYFTLNPEVEANAHFGMWGAVFEASARGGALFIAGGTQREREVRLAGAGGIGPSFTVADKADDVFATLGAAISTTLKDRYTLEAGVDATFSKHYGAVTGSARLSINF
ncbi:autotransporter outer membrane beta-barrel domain-containing protein (plasmid) [Acuticoccus sp. MNP-M23]|uniref:autotransporter outer membrane beta-barrel domain-containing protein n=1 Tax=Acuticoccus sp. MNP-M23 TaxID=3072793 RepID=UPI002814EC27|nr:autotransporter outer membrane beta-barrel domain-containing protein [Acuticoccus sp. MNP-M23]WMS45257.1 autotransporter outer membrane beta-barrel domain-containing protein [Acuticoccus sp. MNP-M23]